MTNTEALRKALELIQRHCANTIRTNSKDPGDWAEDMAYVGKVAADALAQQPAASGGPVAWHMRAIGCDGSADWCELGAAPPEPVHGVEALPLVYAAAQPAPARVPLTDAQVLDLQSRYGWAKATIRAIQDLIFAAPCTANAEVSGCLRAPMPEDAPRTAAGSPLDRPVGPVAGA